MKMRGWKYLLPTGLGVGAFVIFGFLSRPDSPCTVINDHLNQQHAELVACIGESAQWYVHRDFPAEKAAAIEALKREGFRDLPPTDVSYRSRVAYHVYHLKRGDLFADVTPGRPGKMGKEPSENSDWTTLKVFRTRNASDMPTSWYGVLKERLFGPH